MNVSQEICLLLWFSELRWEGKVSFCVFNPTKIALTVSEDTVFLWKNGGYDEGICSGRHP